jgi:hypothetical protein
VERPGGDPEVTSLVAEDGRGKLLGFLGVTATPVILDDTPQTLAGIFPPVVDPDSPATVASFLLRKFLKGPQALTLSDAGHVKFERIWEALGGRIAPTASLRWLKVLRPATLGVASFSARNAAGRVAGPLVRPVAALADRVARRARPSLLGASASPYVGERLTPEAMVDVVARVHAGTRLRPAYRVDYLAWLFAMMSMIHEQGALEAWLVRATDGTPVGWWVAYLRPEGLSRVMVVDGFDRHLDGVVDHLFHHADAAGAGALVGRLEPRLRRVLVSRHVFLHGGGSLQMLHSDDRRLLDDALLGRLALGRLEGENWYWWAIVSRRVP